MGGWQIVKFPDEDNMVEVVPSSWIFKDSEILRCYWPNTISDSKIASCIKSQQIPGPDWKTHVVIVLSKCPYDSFAVAMQKVKKAQYTSGLESENEENHYGPLKRSRRRNPRYISSDDESPVKTPRRSPRFKMPTPPKPNNMSSQQALAAVKHNLGDRLSSVSGSVYSKPQTCSAQAIEGISADEALPNSKNTLNHTGTSSANTSVISEAVNHTGTSSVISEAVSTKALIVPNDFPEVIRLLHIINGRVAQNNKLITAVLTQLSDISTKNDIPDATLNEPNMSLTLPAKSDTELLELDCKMDDSALKTSLVKMLVQVGGDSLKDTVKRMFPKIVEDHVLKQYSWVGGKGKKKFSLLKLTDVIKDVCKQNPNTKLYTEKAVEEVIAVFLTKASERCSRKANKDIAKGTL